MNMYKACEKYAKMRLRAFNKATARLKILMDRDEKKVGCTVTPLMRGAKNRKMAKLVERHINRDLGMGLISLEPGIVGAVWHNPRTGENIRVTSASYAPGYVELLEEIARTKIEYDDYWQIILKSDIDKINFYGAFLRERSDHLQDLLGRLNREFGR